MNGQALIADLRKNHEGWLEDCSARLNWPFAMEHDLFFHGRLHARRLRELFAAADRAAARDPRALAARGRLRRLLGDARALATVATLTFSLRQPVSLCRTSSNRLPR